MRVVIDIPDEMYYNARKGLLMGGDLPLLNEVIANGFAVKLPLDNEDGNKNMRGDV